MATPWLAAKHITVSLTANRIPLVLLAAVLMVAIYAILGVGVGALIRNQVAAVVIMLAYVSLAEPLLGVIPYVRDHVFKFLPGGAANALTQATQPRVHLLEPWQGGLLLLGYGIGFAVLGAVFTIRRDVSRVAQAAAWSGAASYAWVAAGFASFSWQATVAVLLAGAAVIALGLRSPAPRPPAPAQIGRAAVLVWSVPVLAFGA